MIDNNYIINIHNKYYSEHKINNNNNGINTNVNITDAQERVYVEPFMFVVNKNDTCVSDALRNRELFEKFLLSFVKNFIDPTKNILDICANIGVHSIVYSTYTIGTVYAFEPQPVVFELLQKNIESNNCNNIIPYNFGASDKDSTYFMNAQYDIKDNQGAFRICEKEDIICEKEDIICEKEDMICEKEDIWINIECKVVDNLNLSNIGYIKIHVEGHELNTLLGLQNTIRSNLPILMIEIHDTSSTKYDSLKLIEQLGYTYYYKLTHCDYIFTFKEYNLD